MVDTIKNFIIDIFGSELGVFICSMLPIIELRGSIPLGAFLDLPWYVNYFISVIGNLLPVPFILLFIRSVIRWMKGVKIFRKIALWLEAKAEKNQGKLSKGIFVGLFLFVAIPIPGTGAWTGSLVAALMGIKFKDAFFAILIGVLAAGAIMTLASYGVLGFLSIFA
ncbi:MAG: small multi-drug export protein [Clostridia bacterium]|nr:small multi-drug export protein [Clostridia bacterium]